MELGEVSGPDGRVDVGALDQADGAKRGGAEGRVDREHDPPNDAPNVAAATMRDDEGGDDRRDRADEDRDRRPARERRSDARDQRPAEDGAEDEPEQDAPHRGADHVVPRGAKRGEGLGGRRHPGKRNPGRGDVQPNPRPAAPGAISGRVERSPTPAERFLGRATMAAKDEAWSRAIAMADRAGEDVVSGFLDGLAETTSDDVRAAIGIALADDAPLRACAASGGRRGGVCRRLLAALVDQTLP